MLPPYIKFRVQGSEVKTVSIGMRKNAKAINFEP